MRGRKRGKKKGKEVRCVEMKSDDDEEFMPALQPEPVHASCAKEESSGSPSTRVRTWSACTPCMPPLCVCVCAHFKEKTTVK